MYIVISKSKINGNVEVKEIRNLDSALEHMEKQIAKDYKCDLTQKIDTTTEMTVKVKVAEHEEF